MKYTGRDVRLYQDGELVEFEFSLSYSESLEFVAIGAFQDSEIDLNKSKRIEIWYNETKILMSAEFKHVDVISTANCDAIASDLLVFHNGDINIVLDYLRIDGFDRVNNRLRKLELTIKRRRSKHVQRLIKRDNDNRERTSWAVLNLERIPMWIRRIFKAV